MARQRGAGLVKIAAIRHGAVTRVARIEDGYAILVDAIPSLQALLEAGEDGLRAVRAARGEARPLALAPLRAPLGDAPSVICVGLNYAQHAEEGGDELPSAPLLFSKLASSLVGPGEAIRWPAATSGQVDYEAELVAVIGRTARDVTVEEALDVVFGYTCGNDVSARDLQFGDGQWLRGKSLDTFGPVGPWLVTADEIPDPQALAIECVVGGETLQSASTAEMVFTVAELVAYISRHVTLRPGDLVFTGTPPGVGAFRTPPRFLQDGDEVAVTIAGIGTLSNPCRVD